MKIRPFPISLPPRSKKTRSHRLPSPLSMIPIPVQEESPPTVNGSFLFGGFEDASSPWKTLSSQRWTARASVPSPSPDTSSLPQTAPSNRRGEIDLRLVTLGVFIVWAQAISDPSFVFLMLVNRSTDRDEPPVVVCSPFSNQGFRTALVYCSDHPSTPWAVRLIPKDHSVSYTYRVIPL